LLIYQVHLSFVHGLILLLLNHELEILSLLLFLAAVLFPLLTVVLLLVLGLFGLRLSLIVRLLLRRFDFASLIFFVLEVLLGFHGLFVHPLLLAQLPLLVVFVVPFFLGEDITGPLSKFINFSNCLLDEIQIHLPFPPPA